MLKLLLILGLALPLLLCAETKILAFAGSTRLDSYNKKLVNEAAEIAREKGASVTIIDLKDYPLPFYDADFETKQGMPENAKRLRELMIANQGILIASPEYNGSLSAVLKNVIDWVSRNEKGQPSREAFAGKTFAILSTSPGAGGGSRGLGHLKTIIENIGGQVTPKQVVVPNAHTAFDAKGKIESVALKTEIEQEVQELLNKSQS